MAVFGPLQCTMVILIFSVLHDFQPTKCFLKIFVRLLESHRNTCKGKTIEIWISTMKVVAVLRVVVVIVIVIFSNMI